MACLCNTPLCNGNDGDSGSGPVALPQRALQRPQSSNNVEEELSREELSALAQFGSISNQRGPSGTSEVPRSRIPSRNNQNKFKPARTSPEKTRRPPSNFDPQKEVLRKYNGQTLVLWFLLISIVKAFLKVLCTGILLMYF